MPGDSNETSVKERVGRLKKVKMNGVAEKYEYERRIKDMKRE